MILKNKEGLKMEEEVKIKTEKKKKNGQLGIKIFAICAVVVMLFGVSFTTIYMLLINKA